MTNSVKISISAGGICSLTMKSTRVQVLVDHGKQAKFRHIAADSGNEDSTASNRCAESKRVRRMRVPRDGAMPRIAGTQDILGSINITEPSTHGLFTEYIQHSLEKTQNPSSHTR